MVVHGKQHKTCSFTYSISFVWYVELFLLLFLRRYGLHGGIDTIPVCISSACARDNNVGPARR